MSAPKKLLAPILLIIIALVSVWPSVVYISSGVVETYDGLLLVWILNQTIQKIPYDLVNIFQSNIFYPFENTLAFSVLMIPSAFVAYIPTKLFGEPIVAGNFTIIFGQISTMLIAYFWFFDMSKNKTSSFIASAALGLSQIRMHYLVHLQMWTMQWWLFSGWLIWRFLKNQKTWQLYLASVFIALQFWESLLPVYFIALLATILGLLNIRIVKDNLKHIVLGMVIVLLFSSPVISSYYSVSQQFDFQRTIRDAAHFSAGFDDYGDKFFAPGLFLLFGLSLIKLGKEQRIKEKPVVWLLLFFMISFLLSLGPVLKWDGNTVKMLGKIPIPLPYAVLYYIVPGLNAMRTTSRWIWVSAFSVSGITAMAFSNLSIRRNFRIIIILFMVAVIGGTRLLSVNSIPPISSSPPVYQWLKNEDVNTIAEIPLYTWTDKENFQRVFLRMYYSLYHKKRMVNGFSGFTPPQTQQLMKMVRNTGLQKETTDVLASWDVDLLIIHKDEMKDLGLDWESLKIRGKAVWEYENILVFSLN